MLEFSYQFINKNSMEGRILGGNMLFEQIRGILLGTFLSMEENSCRPSIEELVMEYTEGKIPVARTAQIGHRKTELK